MDKTTQSSSGKLSRRRTLIESQWVRFIDGSSLLPKKSLIRGDILSSWQRSSQYIKPRKTEAPVDDEKTASAMWQASLLSQAASQEQAQIIQLAQEGELVAAIADPSGRLLWTHASQHMRDRAEAVNFRAGGHWDERSVGTNAVGLSQRLSRAVTVFSSEHYLPFVHDWVCYAAPIIHPQSGELVGILDMSTTWRRHTPLGQAAVSDLARSIASHLPQNLPRADLELYALGQTRVMFRGQALHLPLRYMEMLCLLALNPNGLTLEQFHAALYREDSRVSTATLKAEISHLRRALDGQIGSRPYRLLVSVWADFIDVWQALRQQRSADALGLYRGALLPQSDAPELEEWRHCIAVVMERAVGDCDDSEVLLDKLCQTTAGGELVRERLAALVSR